LLPVLKSAIDNHNGIRKPNVAKRVIRGRVPSDLKGAIMKDLGRRIIGKRGGGMRNTDGAGIFPNTVSVPLIIGSGRRRDGGHMTSRGGGLEAFD
jgi:hypothetical protein